MLTTDELAVKSGISKRTLARWLADGILKKPALGKGNNGKGRAAYYPDETLERIERIQAMSRDGLLPKEAAVMIDAEDKRGQVPDDFAVPIYKGRPEDVYDLISWIMRRTSKGAKRYYIGIDWIGDDAVAYVDEHVAHEIMKPYLDAVIAEYREAKGGNKKGDDT